ncbi:hypothetical protein ACH49M_21375 [Rhodococcus qingshengii]|uniref:hypothetical protein n=1 Tax=Rhodococcus qingshengii TaxID=334542 RepID=UPI0036FBF62D
MQCIAIGRHEHESVTREYADWIEGIRNDGSTWIMWLDENGSPTQSFAHRDVDGGIEGEAVALSRTSYPPVSDVASPAHSCGQSLRTHLHLRRSVN